MTNTLLIRQAGVLALYEGRVCLITSSSGRRWVIPKGMIDPGHTPCQAAEIEAWEEAGVEGQIVPEAVGSFTYHKHDQDFLVAVFRLEVIDIHDDWPERMTRQREWLWPELAAERVHEAGLRELLLNETD